MGKMSTLDSRSLRVIVCHLIKVLVQSFDPKIRILSHKKVIQLSGMVGVITDRRAPTLPVK